MVKILRGDGTVLRVSGLASVGDLIADGLVGRSDRMFGAGKGVARIGDLDELEWAFATAGDDEPYASYEVITEARRA